LPSWYQQALELLFGAKVAGTRNILPPKDDGYHLCGWMSAACIVGPTRGLRCIGGFDPDYFMYVEDVDLFQRWHSSGRFVAWVPAALVVHKSGSATAPSPLLHAMALTNWTRYFHRTSGPTAAAVISACGLLGSFARGIRWALPSQQRPMASAYRRMFLRGGVLALRMQTSGRYRNEVRSPRRSL
jgi:GT2 family glycosyltransferase